MPNENEGLKYEGLVALMLGVEDRIEKRSKDRHDEFREFVDHRFTKLDQHNEKQNGTIKNTIDRVHNLEHGTKYVKLLKWVDTHPKRSIILIVLSWFITSIAVTNAVCNNWLPRIWDLIIKIAT